MIYRFAFFAVASGILLSFPFASRLQDHKKDDAAATFNRCSSCHFQPDTSLEVDKVWLNNIKSTG